jgi:hypothetical protein
MAGVDAPKRPPGIPADDTPLDIGTDLWSVRPGTQPVFKESIPFGFYQLKREKAVTFGPQG